MSAPLNVLLVEDDEGDVDLVKEALRDKKMGVALNVVNDGAAALRYLRREGPYATVSRPDLVLLDLNLPRKSGQEVLRDMKNDKNLENIPVVVVSTSSAESDILNAYNAGANCYVTKPTGYRDFANTVSGVISFWSRAARRDTGDDPAPTQEVMNVLLIEDDDGDADLLQELLEETKEASLFHFKRAEKLQAGLDVLAQGHYHVDLVLLDLFLPDSEGLVTFSKVQACASSVPVVILSGLSNETLAIETVRQGAQDYLVKGHVDGREVVRVMRYAVERFKSQETMRHLSLTDELTGLHNRRGFRALAERHFNAARHAQKGFLIAFIDLDGLKIINDSFGHKEGDRAIQAVADVLRQTFRATDVLARLGGDEFAVLAPDAPPESAEKLSSLLRKNLESHNARWKGPRPLEFSLGFAGFNGRNAESLDELMSRADAAMYTQKRSKQEQPRR